jgi:hypothetical protein
MKMNVKDLVNAYQVKLKMQFVAETRVLQSVK